MMALPGPMATPDNPPVVTVLANTPYGTMARWFRNLDDARDQQALLTATLAGVFVEDSSVSLTDIPDEWVSAAKAAYRALVDGADVTGLATHRSRFPDGGGPLDPI